MSQSHSALKKLADLVRVNSGINLQEEKFFLIETRLKRLVQELGFSSLTEYTQFAANNPEELQRCIEHLTTHKTEWFREIVHFQWLKKEIKNLTADSNILRIWSAACSAGPEVYSLLFLLIKEGLPAKSFRILGTDISRPILDAALSLPESPEFNEQKTQLLQKSANPENTEKELYLALENSVKFREFNLISGQLDGRLKFDVIFLRNVLIYFEKQTVRLVCKNLARYLKPGGYLVTGLSESLHGELPEFETVGSSIYKLKSASKSLTHAHAKTESKIKQSKQLIKEKETSQVSKKNKILIVEDSKAIQKVLAQTYAQLAGAEVIGVADNVTDAVALFEKNKPHFISLDMNLKDNGTGVDFFKKIDFINYAKKNRARCVLVTDCSKHEGQNVLDAMELGASAYIQKPQVKDLDLFMQEIRELIHGIGLENAERSKTISNEKISKIELSKFKLIAIGSSTGGTEVVRDIISGLPDDAPPIVVVQHMPEQFTGLYAERIQRQSGKQTIEVRTAVELKSGCAYIAAGGTHLIVENKGGSLIARVKSGEAVNRFKPSVSVLFESLLRARLGHNLIALMLTGMGRDGANEMLELKKAGALTIGQDEESCVVYGMPRAAQEIGALCWSASPEKIIAKLK